jgi:hypothetical protein
MALFFKRLASHMLALGGCALVAVRIALDLIGWSTAPDDVGVAMSTVEIFFVWLLGVPWYAPWSFALISTIWLMWVSWPSRSVAGADEIRSDPDNSRLGQSALRSSHERYEFPQPDFDAFILRLVDKPDRVSLHWTSPVSSPFLKIGLDFKRQKEGEVGMGFADTQAISKGYETATPLCKKGEDGNWHWVSKSSSLMSTEQMKCYFVLRDGKNGRWSWGFAILQRDSESEMPVIVGDNLYLMSQRKMF